MYEDTTHEEEKFENSFEDDLETQIDEEKQEEKEEKEYLKCPQCGGALREWDNNYSCVNNKKDDDACNFSIPKKILGAKIKPDHIAELCNDGIIADFLEMKSKKTGKSFKAKIKWNKEENKSELIFPPKINNRM